MNFFAKYIHLCRIDFLNDFFCQMPFVLVAAAISSAIATVAAIAATVRVGAAA